MANDIAAVARVVTAAGLTLDAEQRARLEAAIVNELARQRKAAATLQRSACAAVVGDRALGFMGGTRPDLFRALTAAQRAVMNCELRDK